ncbi:hypothetical protein HBI73_214650 [Parastagonospora nodorum]|nr:hypothetical protein HBH82_230300 [Parastagonospora nodorum]KAH4661505.1 hypothetical protein HBH78_222330 [Parastagonospora nodorum]KAH4691522.1 hypothetical protein HBH67_243240 [Parastagonospora nodorum]KAH4755751.1 hypothetical protein HBH63_231170 [Parastagonospora nodorum]KAH4769776.1 hypothetical protein HBH62_227770 [Parastagonospora nodorum]
MTSLPLNYAIDYHTLSSAPAAACLHPRHPHTATHPHTSLPPGSITIFGSIVLHGFQTPTSSSSNAFTASSSFDTFHPTKVPIFQHLQLLGPSTSTSDSPIFQRLLWYHNYFRCTASAYTLLDHLHRIYLLRRACVPYVAFLASSVTLTRATRLHVCRYIKDVILHLFIDTFPRTDSQSPASSSPVIVTPRTCSATGYAV